MTDRIWGRGYHPVFAWYVWVICVWGGAYVKMISSIQLPSARLLSSWTSVARCSESWLRSTADENRTYNIRLKIYIKKK